jgi:hypothetical protein
MHLYWAQLGKTGQVEEDLKQYFSYWTSTLIIYAIQAMVLAFIAGSCAVLAPSFWLVTTIYFIGLAFFFFSSKASVDQLRKYCMEY